MNNNQGVRNHLCQVSGCTSSFARKHDLQRHMRTLHNPDRRFQCLNCNSIFQRDDELKRHVSSVSFDSCQNRMRLIHSYSMNTNLNNHLNFADYTAKIQEVESFNRRQTRPIMEQWNKETDKQF